PENKVDQQHEFDTRVNHRFSERYSVNFEDSFVSSTEPEVVDQGAGAQASFQRSTFSAIRNRATIDYNGRLTPITGFGMGYQNSYYNYSQNGDGSLSALLDRIDQLAHLDAIWFPVEHTKLLVGYQFTASDFISSDFLVDNPAVPPAEKDPSLRNSLSHTFYLGGERQFNPQFLASANLGAQYTDYYNEHMTDLSPYADMSANYTYLPGSYARLGVKVAHFATDSGLGTNGTVTLDQLATTTYITVNH